MLQTTRHSTLLIVAPQAPMTLPHAIPLLQDMEDSLSKSDVRDLVIDLAGVRELDGSGLGVMVKAITKARSSGQGFYLYRPSKEAIKALQEFEVYGFFPILDHEEDLLAHIPD